MDAFTGILPIVYRLECSKTNKQRGRPTKRHATDVLMLLATRHVKPASRKLGVTIVQCDTVVIRSLKKKTPKNNQHDYTQC